MIITNIAGGLGNQMFQYAAARALAILNNTEVYLDTSSFRQDQLRNFDLAQLDTQFRYADDNVVSQLKANNTWKRTLSWLTPYSKKSFYKQPYFHFDQSFFHLTANTYIKGYFQSEKYFEPIKEQIRTELRVKDHLLQNVLELGTKINTLPSVSIHIRRGDYKNPAAIDYHGILPISYYEQAIKMMLNEVPNAQFYLFTDDKDWVAQHLSLPNAILISGNYSETHFEDLYLMSQCRHNIIANSSFSWWGAWLGIAPTKKVIAPNQWFKQGPKDTYDLIPSRWQRI